MLLPVALRQSAFRLAHALLRVYWFVRRPHINGVKCVLTDGDRVLLVRHTYGPTEWELPGGRIKRREPALTAARRECSEELGVAITDWVSLGELSGRMHHRHDTLHCFHVELRAPRLTLARAELAAASWFPRDRLPRDLGQYVWPILARAHALGGCIQSSSPRGASRTLSIPSTRHSGSKWRS